MSLLSVLNVLFTEGNQYLSSKAFRSEISDLLQDLSGLPIDASSRYARLSFVDVEQTFNNSFS